MFLCRPHHQCWEFYEKVGGLGTEWLTCLEMTVATSNNEHVEVVNQNTVNPA